MVNAQKYCEECHKPNWELSKDGHLVRLNNGVVQIGQGRRKPLITFCSEKCSKKYQDKRQSL